MNSVKPYYRSISGKKNSSLGVVSVKIVSSIVVVVSISVAPVVVEMWGPATALATE